MTLESYWLENYPYYDSRVIIFARTMFIRLATGDDVINKFYNSIAMLSWNKAL